MPAKNCTNLMTFLIVIPYKDNCLLNVKIYNIFTKLFLKHTLNMIIIC